MSGVNGFEGFLHDIIQGQTKIVKVKPIFIGDKGEVLKVDISKYDFHLDIDYGLDISTAPAVSITNLAGIGVDPVAGEVTITLGASETASLNVGDVYYQIRAVNPADPDESHTLDMGKISVLGAVAA